MNHDKIYEAFPMDVSTEDGKTDSSGFCLYLDRSLLAADGNQIEILNRQQRFSPYNRRTDAIKEDIRNEKNNSTGAFKGQHCQAA